ncbi:MAG: cytochrome c biogenesis protein ResB [Clostridia bacterium]|nr:cytochrome c biogenesis protein ResB [Clostridia bacterium]
MKLLKASVWIMAIIGVFLVIGSLCAAFGIWDSYHRSIFFIVAIVVFTIVLIICLVRCKFSLKKLGFYICHTGVLVIIVCSIVSALTLKETSFAIPVDPDSFYGEVQQNDGAFMEFGYYISVASFDVEKYDAEYCLYNSKTDFVEKNIVIETVSQNRNGIYDMGEYGTVSAVELKKDGEYVKYYTLENGYVLVKNEEIDKNYTAVFQIYDEGEIKKAELGVNKPYTYKGWKFYLMGYDTEGMQYVNLYVKNDPANIPFAVGMWMTIVGTFIECFLLIKPKGRDRL